MVDPTRNQVYVTESTLEDDALHILLTDHSVEHVLEQPPAVEYRDSQDTKRRHTFDFLATMTNGDRIAMAVKPHDRVIPSGIKSTVRRIKAQVGDEFADIYCICTEAEISKEKAENGRLILRCRPMWVNDHVIAMAEFASKFNGALIIGELVCHSGLGKDGMPAVVNLIDAGFLEVSDGLIDHFSFVRLAERKTAMAA